MFMHSLRRIYCLSKFPKCFSTLKPYAEAPQEIISLDVEEFRSRHIGPDAQESQRMLSELGYDSEDAFIKAVLPQNIPTISSLNLPPALAESEMSMLIREYGSNNKVMRSFIGQGFYGTHLPSVLKRNILENPAWYTPYTPYQSEISQGRLDALFNFQTMVCELTGLPLANASLLDEASAAAEAMTMLFYAGSKRKKKFLICTSVFPSTLECIKLRAEGLGINVVEAVEDRRDVFGALFQYPDRDGSIMLNTDLLRKLKNEGIPTACAVDPLALSLLKPPGECGFDIAFGSAQRFGLPLGYGGPHAAFLACTEKYKRLLPGRVVGLSKDTRGMPAFRLALQTREQHIRREKATSNICTAQALLASMASMYGVYHGPAGLERIGRNVNKCAVVVADAAIRLGHTVRHHDFFDSLVICLKEPKADVYHSLGLEYGMNFRKIGSLSFGISMDETVRKSDVTNIVKVLSGQSPGETNEDVSLDISEFETPSCALGIPEEFKRQSQFMQQPVFNSYHNEASMMRYIHGLARKDFSLLNSMVPLGSCTMKLNGATSLSALSLPEYSDIHPLAPVEQCVGYAKVLEELKAQLSEITGFKAITLQPNSGAQGEYLALSTMRQALKDDSGRAERNLALIPTSAHGTNPASASLAGFQTISVHCTKEGRIDLSHLNELLDKHEGQIGVLVVTYPSTYGIFDESILQACEAVKKRGIFVYMDGANMNAMTGYIRPADLGMDACHLNLHKTFCIPHGGGGPGVGPIGVSEELSKYLNSPTLNSVCSSPHGSASIQTIPWAFISQMGSVGLREGTMKALLNANYLRSRLVPYYPMPFSRHNEMCAHEFIIDMRKIEEATGITAFDDYGFHAPTMSWPLPNSLLIEPTESENLAELDRFIKSMISIRSEIADIEHGKSDRSVNPVKLAPHTELDVCSESWDRPYSRMQAVYPLGMPSLKVWPAVNRLDDVFGDQNLVCSHC